MESDAFKGEDRSLVARITRRDDGADAWLIERPGHEPDSRLGRVPASTAIWHDAVPDLENSARVRRSEEADVAHDGPAGLLNDDPDTESLDLRRGRRLGRQNIEEVGEWPIRTK
jgi:hypothetical protein